MLGIHDGWDVWRLCNLLVGLLCVIWSVGGYMRQHETWNAKTFNMWYSRLMWAIVECVVSFEGIQKGADWSYTLGFITIAGLSSFVALQKRGAWGSPGSRPKNQE